MKIIDVPDAIRSGELLCVVSMSGGKDSTAAALALREAGVEARYVFADTGWEAPETYEHLDVLREKIGPISVVGTFGGMVAKIRARAGFPARKQRWCTRELKIKPLRDHHDLLEKETGRETACVVGIRAAESKERAKLAVWEDDTGARDEHWDGWVWRPILDWTIDEVIAIHHRHGVPVNPLYQRGHSRVGCYPCIMADKEEIRLVAEHAPWRIDEIRALERDTTLQRADRNAEEPGRYNHPEGTFFQSVDRKRAGVMPIDRVVTWSRTTRGGVSFLCSPPPRRVAASAGDSVSRRRRTNEELGKHIHHGARAG